MACVLRVLVFALCWVGSAAVQPIIIVPGLGGSVLEAQVHNRSRFRDCATSSDWFTIWFSQTQIAWRFACFMEGMKLVPGTDTAVQNASGVEIRARDFGGLSGVEYSNAGAHDLIPMPYLHKMVRALESQGYKSGVSLRAATYDFRAAGMPDQLENQFTKLKQLVEDTFSMNNQQPVHLLSHSLGGPYANLFLTSYVNQEWKDKFISSHMMFSPPMAGTPVALEALIIGPQYDFVPSFLPAIVVPALRTFPSMLWMFPFNSAASSMWSDQILVRTPTRNYTANDYEALFEAMDAPLLSRALKQLPQATNLTASDPGVRVFCAYVNDTKTTTSFELNSNLTRLVSTLEQTWGDGTVPLESLDLCARWADKKSVYQFGGSLAAHTEILTNQNAIDDIISWVGL